MSAQAQSAAAEQFKAPDATEMPTAASSLTESTADPKIEEADDDDQVRRLPTPATPTARAYRHGTGLPAAQDETGLEPKDIELVMNQAGVSRAKAVKALKNQNSDIVNAIMVRISSAASCCCGVH
jgi:nascent polypeptide-associated complex subunit alpha